MGDSRHFGLIGGLGVGATVLYYQGITAACTARHIIPRITIAHADAPSALALVQAGRIEGLADYLSAFISEASAAGAEFVAIPAITPHICRAELKARVTVPLVDLLDVTARCLRERRLNRVALFGTKFTIDSSLFGALGEFDVVRPCDGDVEEIHRIYLELATRGHCAPDDEARLREIAGTLCRREGVEAIVLAGTDLNLIFDETNAGFPAVDCAAVHIAAIVDQMAE
ncbi:MAG: aspartate/glutamate racemase family protein [Hyphomicrobiaceae bacterium]